MNTIKSSSEPFDKGNQSSFDRHALATFQKQAQDNVIYRSYLEFLGVQSAEIKKTTDIPFLPIEFFKYHAVKTNEWSAEKVFESSGTTGIYTSRHYVRSEAAYHQNAKQIFEEQFGSLPGKTIIGLLPSYLERNNSSLVSMVDYFVNLSKNSRSGFYLNELEELLALLTQPLKGEDIYLFGVSFALLDLAEWQTVDLSHVTVIETGGMKGRREELVREEMYDILRQRLNLQKLYSEYGMTELLSQAYGKEGRMILPSTMKVMIRDINDPFNYLKPGKTGGINIIDLANQDSCAFIETKDLGRMNLDGTLEILGRFDNSDIRGCNLMVT